MTAPPDKPSVRDVLPLVHDIYRSEGHSVGGCLHIVLDDGNIEDGNIQWCLDHGQWPNMPACEKCAHVGRLMLKMSRSQRKRLSRNCYPPVHEDAPAWWPRGLEFKGVSGE